MRIYLATWLEDKQGLALTKSGNKNRLLSFFFLKDNRTILPQYVMEGKFGSLKTGSKK